VKSDKTQLCFTPVTGDAGFLSLWERCVPCLVRERPGGSRRPVGRWHTGPRARPGSTVLP